MATAEYHRKYRLMKRVLVETRFCGNHLDNGWYPDYQGIAVAETESRYKVKRHWWSRGEWMPKSGEFIRVRVVTPLTEIKK